MKHFVFRNNTIERFFSEDFTFSGYDDISIIPTEAENYVWFYQSPIKSDTRILAEEIDAIAQKFSFVLDKIAPEKTVVVLTMTPLFKFALTEDDDQVEEAINRYNHVLREQSLRHTNVKVIDICDFTSKYSLSELFDWRFYFISQMGMNPRLALPFQSWFEKKMNGIALKRKKCLILDLDNTLWGGVLGEDGIDGIKIGGDYPGNAFLYFQKAILELEKAGVILAVCSKNNEQDVKKAWEKNPFIVLTEEHFACCKINWNDKATNIKEIAEELNIGLDSFVFIDDNPTERELVRQTLPMVAVPDFPAQPYDIPVFFKNLVDKYFKVYSITEEDKNKTLQYKANVTRMQAQKSFVDFDKFLESLEMRVSIEAATEYNIPRIAQMTQKTNQFNLTTKRYTEADIKRFLKQGWKIWCLRVQDKFGDNGITGCIMLNGNEIDTFLLSCRILGKGIEVAFLRTILAFEKNSGEQKVHAKYIPTEKNGQVREFYDNNGFLCSQVGIDGTKLYKITLDSADLSVKQYYNVTVI